MKILISEVRGHEGKCKPTWLNLNTIYNRLDGGITGFFRNIKKSSFLFFNFNFKYGEEFHGIIKNNKVVSTNHKWTLINFVGCF